MKREILCHCHLVTPGAELADAALEIEDGVIVRTEPGAPSWALGGRDLEGRMVMPGFIDVHCHGRNNVDFSDGSAEAVRTIAENKLAEGVTTLLPTTLTLPEIELVPQHDVIDKLPMLEFHQVG